jgi:hypothetical protein
MMAEGVVKASPVITGSDKATRGIRKREVACWNLVVFGRRRKLTM